MKINDKIWKKAKHILKNRKIEIEYIDTCRAAGICPYCGWETESRIVSTSIYNSHVEYICTNQVCPSKKGDIHEGTC